MPQPKKQETERTVTRRLVLRRAHVLELPVEVEGQKWEDVAKVITEQLKAGGSTLAWVECGEFVGSRIQAIEGYAGKPGTPDAKVGDFKAPPVSGMRGGVRYVQPALPKVERTAID